MQNGDSPHREIEDKCLTHIPYMRFHRNLQLELIID